MAASLLRIAAGFTLAAAPAVIFLGAAWAHADASVANHCPSAGHPTQHNTPKPGTSVHHRHQHHHHAK